METVNCVARATIGSAQDNRIIIVRRLFSPKQALKGSAGA